MNEALLRAFVGKSSEGYDSILPQGVSPTFDSSISSECIRGISYLRRKSLIIACDNPSFERSDSTCHTDGSAMSALLVSLGFECAFLHDESSPSCYPTISRVCQYFDWLVRDALPGDCLILYFSGQSVKFPRLDATAMLRLRDGPLPMSVFWWYARRLPAGTKLTCLMDCAWGSEILPSNLWKHPNSSDWKSTPPDITVTMKEIVDIDPKWHRMSKPTQNELEAENFLISQLITNPFENWLWGNSWKMITDSNVNNNKKSHRLDCARRSQAVCNILLGGSLNLEPNERRMLFLTPKVRVNPSEFPEAIAERLWESVRRSNDRKTAIPASGDICKCDADLHVLKSLLIQIPQALEKDLELQRKILCVKCFPSGKIRRKQSNGQLLDDDLEFWIKEMIKDGRLDTIDDEDVDYMDGGMLKGRDNVVNKNSNDKSKNNDILNRGNASNNKKKDKFKEKRHIQSQKNNSDSNNFSEASRLKEAHKNAAESRFRAFSTLIRIPPSHLPADAPLEDLIKHSSTLSLCHSPHFIIGANIDSTVIAASGPGETAFNILHPKLGNKRGLFTSALMEVILSDLTSATASNTDISVSYAFSRIVSAFESVLHAGDVTLPCYQRPSIKVSVRGKDPKIQSFLMFSDARAIRDFERQLPLKVDPVFMSAIAVKRHILEMRLHTAMKNLIALRHPMLPTIKDRQLQHMINDGSNNYLEALNENNNMITQNEKPNNIEVFNQKFNLSNSIQIHQENQISPLNLPSVNSNNNNNNVSPNVNLRSKDLSAFYLGNLPSGNSIIQHEASLLKPPPDESPSPLPFWLQFIKPLLNPFPSMTEKDRSGSPLHVVEHASVPGFYDLEPAVISSSTLEKTIFDNSNLPITTNQNNISNRGHNGDVTANSAPNAPKTYSTRKSPPIDGLLPPSAIPAANSVNFIITADPAQGARGTAGSIDMNLQQEQTNLQQQQINQNAVLNKMLLHSRMSQHDLRRLPTDPQESSYRPNHDLYRSFVARKSTFGGADLPSPVSHFVMSQGSHFGVLGASGMSENTMTVGNGNSSMHVRSEVGREFNKDSSYFDTDFNLDEELPLNKSKLLSDFNVHSPQKKSPLISSKDLNHRPSNYSYLLSPRSVNLNKDFNSHERFESDQDSFSMSKSPRRNLTPNEDDVHNSVTVPISPKQRDVCFRQQNADSNVFKVDKDYLNSPPNQIITANEKLSKLISSLHDNSSIFLDSKFQSDSVRTASIPNACNFGLRSRAIPSTASPSQFRNAFFDGLTVATTRRKSRRRLITEGKIFIKKENQELTPQVRLNSVADEIPHRPLGLTVLSRSLDASSVPNILGVHVDEASPSVHIGHSVVGSLAASNVFTASNMRQNFINDSDLQRKNFNLPTTNMSYPDVVVLETNQSYGAVAHSSAENAFVNDNSKGYTLRSIGAHPIQSIYSSNSNAFTSDVPMENVIPTSFDQIPEEDDGNNIVIRRVAMDIKGNGHRNDDNQRKTIIHRRGMSTNNNNNNSLSTENINSQFIVDQNSKDFKVESFNRLFTRQFTQLSDSFGEANRNDNEDDTAHVVDLSVYGVPVDNQNRFCVSIENSANLDTKLTSTNTKTVSVEGTSNPHTLPFTIQTEKDYHAFESNNNFLLFNFTHARSDSADIASVIDTATLLNDVNKIHSFDGDTSTNSYHGTDSCFEFAQNGDGDTHTRSIDHKDTENNYQSVLHIEKRNTVIESQNKSENNNFHSVGSADGTLRKLMVHIQSGHDTLLNIPVQQAPQQLPNITPRFSNFNDNAPFTSIQESSSNDNNLDPNATAPHPTSNPANNTIPMRKLSSDIPNGTRKHLKMLSKSIAESGLKSYISNHLQDESTYHINQSSDPTRNSQSVGTRHTIMHPPHHLHLDDGGSIMGLSATQLLGNDEHDSGSDAFAIDSQVNFLHNGDNVTVMINTQGSSNPPHDNDFNTVTSHNKNIFTNSSITFSHQNVLHLEHVNPADISQLVDVSKNARHVHQTSGISSITGSDQISHAEPDGIPVSNPLKTLLFDAKSGIASPLLANPLSPKSASIVMGAKIDWVENDDDDDLNSLWSKTEDLHKLPSSKLLGDASPALNIDVDQNNDVNAVISFAANDVLDSGCETNTPLASKSLRKLQSLLPPTSMANRLNFLSNPNPNLRSQSISPIESPTENDVNVIFKKEESPPLDSVQDLSVVQGSRLKDHLNLSSLCSDDESSTSKDNFQSKKNASLFHCDSFSINNAIPSQTNKEYPISVSQVIPQNAHTDSKLNSCAVNFPTSLEPRDSNSSGHSCLPFTIAEQLKNHSQFAAPTSKGNKYEITDSEDLDNAMMTTLQIGNNRDSDSSNDIFSITSPVVLIDSEKQKKLAMKEIAYGNIIPLHDSVSSLEGSDCHLNSNSGNYHHYAHLDVNLSSDFDRISCASNSALRKPKCVNTIDYVEKLSLDSSHDHASVLSNSLSQQKTFMSNDSIVDTSAQAQNEPSTIENSKPVNDLTTTVAKSHSSSPINFSARRLTIGGGGGDSTFTLESEIGKRNNTHKFISGHAGIAQTTNKIPSCFIPHDIAGNNAKSIVFFGNQLSSNSSNNGLNVSAGEAAAVAIGLNSSFLVPSSSQTSNSRNVSSQWSSPRDPAFNSEVVNNLGGRMLNVGLSNNLEMSKRTLMTNASNNNLHSLNVMDYENSNRDSQAVSVFDIDHHPDQIDHVNQDVNAHGAHGIFANRMSTATAVASPLLLSRSRNLGCDDDDDDSESESDDEYDYFENKEVYDRPVQSIMSDIDINFTELKNNSHDRLNSSRKKSNLSNARIVSLSNNNNINMSLPLKNINSVQNSNPSINNNFSSAQSSPIILPMSPALTAMTKRGRRDGHMLEDELNFLLLQHDGHQHFSQLNVSNVFNDSARSSEMINKIEPLIHSSSPLLMHTTARSVDSHSFNPFLHEKAQLLLPTNPLNTPVQPSASPLSILAPPILAHSSHPHGKHQSSVVSPNESVAPIVTDTTYTQDKAKDNNNHVIKQQVIIPQLPLHSGVSSKYGNFSLNDSKLPLQLGGSTEIVSISSFTSDSDSELKFGEEGGVRAMSSDVSPSSKKKVDFRHIQTQKKPRFVGRSKTTSNRDLKRRSSVVSSNIDPDVDFKVYSPSHNYLNNFHFQDTSNKKVSKNDANLFFMDVVHSDPSNLLSGSRPHTPLDASASILAVHRPPPSTVAPSALDLKVGNSPNESNQETPFVSDDNTPAHAASNMSRNPAISPRRVRKRFSSAVYRPKDKLTPHSAATNNNDSPLSYIDRELKDGNDNTQHHITTPRKSTPGISVHSIGHLSSRSHRRRNGTPSKRSNFVSRSKANSRRYLSIGSDGKNHAAAASSGGGFYDVALAVARSESKTSRNWKLEAQAAGLNAIIQPVISYGVLRKKNKLSGVQDGTSANKISASDTSSYVENPNFTIISGTFDQSAMNSLSGKLVNAGATTASKYHSISSGPVVISGSGLCQNALEKNSTLYRKFPLDSLDVHLGRDATTFGVLTLDTLPTSATLANNIRNKLEEARNNWLSGAGLNPVHGYMLHQNDGTVTSSDANHGRRRRPVSLPGMAMARKVFATENGREYLSVLDSTVRKNAIDGILQRSGAAAPQMVSQEGIPDAAPLESDLRLAYFGHNTSKDLNAISILSSKSLTAAYGNDTNSTEGFLGSTQTILHDISRQVQFASKDIAKISKSIADRTEFFVTQLSEEVKGRFEAFHAANSPKNNQINFNHATVENFDSADRNLRGFLTRENSKEMMNMNSIHHPIALIPGSDLFLEPNHGGNAAAVGRVSSGPLRHSRVVDLNALFSPLRSDSAEFIPSKY